MGGWRIVAAKPAGLGLLVVVENPALVGGSGSDLGVVPHDVRGLLVVLFIVGYIVGVLERPLCWHGLCDYRHEHDVGLVVGEMLSDKCLGIL